MRRITQLLACLVLPLVLACGGDTTQPVPPPAPPPPGPPPPPPPPAPVASVTVTPGASSLVPQQTVQLAAQTRDAGGAVLSGRAIAWTSATPVAASVSAAGVVTAVAPGASVVTATSEGQSGTAAITVVDGGVILPAGNSFSAGAGAVSIQAPAGAVTAGTAITVAPLASPPAHPDLIPGTAWSLGPDGTTFAQPVTVRITWTAAQLPAGAVAEQIRVHRHNGTVWEPLQAGAVNVATRTASGTTTAFSPFALIEIPSNPLPVLSSVAPTSVIAGSTGLTLTVSGTGFVAASEVLWNGAARPTTLVSATQLTAAIPASDLLASGTVQVTVVNPAPGGGTSAALPFTITSPVGEFLASKVWAGGTHSCAMTLTDGLYCWGWNDDGQLGSGSTVDADHPVKVAGGHAFADFSPGFFHNCALTGSGAAYCWGWGGFGRLGTGNSDSRNEPTAVTGGHTWASVSAGPGHSCGVTLAGTGYCWGWNESRRLGTGTAIGSSSTPVLVAGEVSFSEISAGGRFGCGLATDGAAWCWGRGSEGQVGHGSFATEVPAPVAVSGGRTYTTIAAGMGHACAIATSGTTYCWGTGANGRLGQDLLSSSSTPIEVQGSQTFVSLSVGSDHTCALTAAGAAYCWGAGSLGRLGHGTIEDKSVPTLVAGGHVFTTISAGDEHSCGTTTVNEVYCWGWADALGAGSNVDQLVPVRVVFAAANGAPWSAAQPGRGGRSTEKGDAATTGSPLAGRR